MICKKDKVILYGVVFPVVDGEELVRVVGDVEGGGSGLAVVLTGLGSTNNTEVEFKRQINSPGPRECSRGMVCTVKLKT